MYSRFFWFYRPFFVFCRSRCFLFHLFCNELNEKKKEFNHLDNIGTRIKSTEKMEYSLPRYPPTFKQYMERMKVLEDAAHLREDNARLYLELAVVRGRR